MDAKRPVAAIPFSYLRILPLICCVLIGCTRPIPPEGPTGARVAGEDLEPLWQASLAVLRRHELQPDRQDRVTGVITTLPTTTGQWFEWWRQDTADPYSVAQANLQTVRRGATVRFVKDEAAGDWTIRVQVDVSRLTIPAYQVTSASAAIQSFSGVLPTAEGQLREPNAVRRWEPIGRDGAMEARLLDEILGRVGLDVPIEAETADGETKAGDDTEAGAEADSQS